MLNALESTLTKLARYDEGNLLAPILSLTYKQGMSSSGKDIGKQYVTFVSNCCDLLRHKINDELWIVNLLEVSMMIINIKLPFYYPLVYNTNSIFNVSSPK